MANEQLMKAFQLMKDGEKRQSLLIVRSILSEDPGNANAWWLMSHLMTDEDKEVKALERVLAIEPEHRIARQRLAKLRPEYGNLVPDDVNTAKQSKKDALKANANYWKKLDRRPVASKSSSIPGWLFSRFALRIAIFLVIAIFGSVTAFFNSIQSDKALPDINGNTPQYAIETFIRAAIAEDRATIYSITCPAIRSYADSVIADFDGGYEGFTVDFTNTVFDLEHHDYRNDRAYITLSGSALAFGSGISTTINWREAAAADGYDFFGEFTAKIDGQWLVCEEYSIPNVDHESSK